MDMNEELTNKLLNEFPMLYRQTANSEDSLMQWGFCVGDGWFDLIWQLSRDIENIAKLSNGLGQEPPDWPRVVQVKEKFGRLRFHLRSNDDRIQALARAAEEKSYQICEKCGGPGQLMSDGGYLFTMCEEHAKQFRPKARPASADQL